MSPIYLVRFPSQTFICVTIEDITRETIIITNNYIETKDTVR